MAWIARFQLRPRIHYLSYQLLLRSLCVFPSSPMNRFLQNTTEKSRPGPFMIGPRADRVWSRVAAAVVPGALVPPCCQFRMRASGDGIIANFKPPEAVGGEARDWLNGLIGAKNKIKNMRGHSLPLWAFLTGQCWLGHVLIARLASRQDNCFPLPPESYVLFLGASWRTVLQDKTARKLSGQQKTRYHK